MKKKDDFAGQRMIVLPEKIISTIINNVLTNDAFVSDIGFFPAARDHYRIRHLGSMQNILIYCVDGSGWISVDGKRSEISNDQYFIIPKNTPHSYAASDEDPWTIYWVHFAGNRSEHLLNKYDMTKKSIHADKSLLEERIRFFDWIYFSLESEYSESNLEYAGLVLMLFLSSFIFTNQFRKVNETEYEDVSGKAIEFMKTNIGKKISLEEVAEYCSISVSHLCLVFKKSTSHTPMEYYNNIRVQRACQLLDLTRLKIHEVASNLGFSDAFYFSRVFKKAIGQSPDLYRKRRSG